MFALFCFVLAVLTSPFKSKNRLDAENAALRHQLIVLRRKVQGPGPTDEQRSLVFDPALSMVSIDFAGRHDRPSGDHRALAPGRLSSLLAMKAPSAGRPTANRSQTSAH